MRILRLVSTLRDRGLDLALLEVSNRGGKASLAYFNGARRSRDPVDEAHFGEGFLVDQDRERVLDRADELWGWLEAWVGRTP